MLVHFAAELMCKTTLLISRQSEAFLAACEAARHWVPPPSPENMAHKTGSNGFKNWRSKLKQVVDKQVEQIRSILSTWWSMFISVVGFSTHRPRFVARFFGVRRKPWWWYVCWTSSTSCHFLKGKMGVKPTAGWLSMAMPDVVQLVLLFFFGFWPW